VSEDREDATVGDTRAVRDWWEAAARDLPWRHSRDPWEILVAEVMLQQTQVDRVVPRWRRFLERFPDPAVCAAAPAGDVIEEWAGLGYNRRALALHRCARAVVADHDGDLPADLEALLDLPAIGPYTARAVLVFALERHHGVLDTNVARVLARRAGRRLKPAEAQRAADAAVPEGGSWWWNQAVLDLGAQVCTARSPECAACPVRPGCLWQGGLDGTPDPAVGSAAVAGPQSRFAGSDRQGRGRLVDALRRGPVPMTDVAEVAGWPEDEDRAHGVAAGLVVDGLAVSIDGTLRLP
jgi:A/G-specific adenine glycosylase